MNPQVEIQELPLCPKCSTPLECLNCPRCGWQKEVSTTRPLECTDPEHHHPEQAAARRNPPEKSECPYCGGGRP